MCIDIRRHTLGDEIEHRRGEDIHPDQCDGDTDDDTHDRTRYEEDMIHLLTHLVGIEDHTELRIRDHDDDPTDVEHDRCRRIGTIDDRSPIGIADAEKGLWLHESAEHICQPCHRP